MDEIGVTNWILPGSDGQPIYGNTHRPSGAASGVLICCHGFKGYKDYGFFPLLCDQAARRGLVALRFNFSHSGMTNNFETFERPDLFEKDTWGRQVSDLTTVIQHFAEDEDTASLPFVLFGHSRGGVSACLATSRLCAPDVYNRLGYDTVTHASPAGLITAAAPDDACNLDDLVKEQLRADGRLLSPSGRTGQKLYVGLDWLKEIERNPDLYDPVLAAAHINCPILILHGDNDDTVPVQCAQHLHQAAKPFSKLVTIEGANHVFNCPNPAPTHTPLQKLPIQTQTLIQGSIDFALRCCSGASSESV